MNLKYKLNQFLKLIKSSSIDESVILESWFDMSKEESLHLGEKVCKELGIYLHSFLGKGAYSAAYDVVVNGKRKVLKVTFDNDEISKTKTFNDLKESTPQKYHKFFMDISDPGQVTITLNGNKVNVYYLYAEVLKPISFSLDKLSLIQNNTFDDFIKTKQYVQELVMIDNYKYFKQKGIISFIEETLSNRFDDFIIRGGETNDMNTYKYINFYLNQESKEEFINKFIHEIDTNFDLTEDISLYDLLSDYYDLLHHEFPTFYESGGRDKAKISPGLEEFMEFLSFLEKKFKILYQDLHDANIMMRDNGDLVLSDVGLFEFRAL